MLRSGIWQSTIDLKSPCIVGQDERAWLASVHPIGFSIEWALPFTSVSIAYKGKDWHSLFHSPRRAVVGGQSHACVFCKAQWFGKGLAKKEWMKLPCTEPGHWSIKIGIVFWTWGLNLGTFCMPSRCSTTDLQPFYWSCTKADLGTITGTTSISGHLMRIEHLPFFHVMPIVGGLTCSVF